MTDALAVHLSYRQSSGFRQHEGDGFSAVPFFTLIGTKRTYQCDRTMSALRGKADMARTCFNVRL
jgi:hypothetical protein